VLEGLSVLTEACLQHGANVLLMTVMEVAEPEPRSEQQRLELNKFIKQYAQGDKWAAAAAAAAAGSADAPQQQQQQQQQAVGGSPVSRRGAPRVVLFDLASKLTWGGMDEETRWQMWDDGVHLTIDGYDLMGDLIVEALGPLVQHDVGQAAAGSAAATVEQNGTSDHKKSL
jgi:lysophospholipase L1-like esterase